LEAVACPHRAAAGGAGDCERCDPSAAKRERAEGETQPASVRATAEEALRRLRELGDQLRGFREDIRTVSEEMRDDVARFRAAVDEARREVAAAEEPGLARDVEAEDEGPVLATTSTMTLEEMEEFVFDRFWHEGNGEKMRTRREIDLLTKVGARELRRYNTRGSRLWLRRRRGMRRGRRAGHQRAPYGMRPGEIAVIPTIVAAAERMGGIGKVGKSVKLDIEEQDIRERLRRGRTPCAIVVVVDLGSSIDEEAKQERILPAVLDVLRACYERRDQVALVLAKGDRAEVAEEFTTDLDALYARVQRLEFGGLSPLASGMTKALDLLNDRMRVPLGIVPIMIVLTDGRANVPLYQGGHIKRELWRISRSLEDSPVSAMFMDVSDSGDRMVRDLASAADGVYFRPRKKLAVL
jgi:Mg-chelatase subunit ChlD